MSKNKALDEVQIKRLNNKLCKAYDLLAKAHLEREHFKLAGELYRDSLKVKESASMGSFVARLSGSLTASIENIKRATKLMGGCLEYLKWKKDCSGPLMKIYRLIKNNSIITYNLSLPSNLDSLSVVRKKLQEFGQAEEDCNKKVAVKLFGDGQNLDAVNRRGEQTLDELNKLLRKAMATVKRAGEIVQLGKVVGGESQEIYALVLVDGVWRYGYDQQWQEMGKRKHSCEGRSGIEVGSVIGLERNCK
ncbi:hypothetical protein PPACK8108_LOCUS20717 [Phakopsora pachyrhizi]|uniref:Uncharacterized protein n=1 Tax=Phakopsora pachyrhizi TaxID=170000 RepID=A0AAV0BG22_PHAPC|nr:hypothetical protein PPACK8108_LOCUS20717 [Phakopsora pachyrhizi]